MKSNHHIIWTILNSVYTCQRLGINYQLDLNYTALKSKIYGPGGKGPDQGTSRVNNETILEFIFEKDPNLFMRKNKIVIRGAIELGADILPDNGYVAKLFSMLSVEVDSQNVSSNRNKSVIISYVSY